MAALQDESELSELEGREAGAETDTQSIENR